MEEAASLGDLNSEFIQDRVRRTANFAEDSSRRMLTI